jgi:hypothetical protein
VRFCALISWCQGCVLLASRSPGPGPPGPLAPRPPGSPGQPGTSAVSIFAISKLGSLQTKNFCYPGRYSAVA